MYNTLMKLEALLTRLVEAILTLLFIAIFIMVFYQVVLRYLFSESIFGTAEVYTVLFAYASAFGAAVMIRKREHIKISVFVDMLPRQIQKIVLSIDYLLVAVFSFFIVRTSIPWLYSIRLFRSPVTGISRATESIAIPAGFALILFYCIINVLALFLDPAEAEQEIGTMDIEARRMLEAAAEADRRFLDHSVESTRRNER